MARARLSYDQRMGQRLSREASRPVDWVVLAKNYTRVFQIDYESPVSGKRGRGFVLALNAAHAMAVLNRRFEAIDRPMDVADYCMNAVITRLPKNTPFEMAQETPEETVARGQEMERQWMFGGQER